MNFIKINMLTPIQNNLVDLCKFKTFVWAQYLAKNNKINLKYYKKDEIYVNYNDIMKHILFVSLSIDVKKINYYKLIYQIENNYFVYKILIDTQFKNLDLEYNNYTLENNKNTFVYPTVIYFLEKTKLEELDKYLINRLCINIKCLFKMEVEIIKIVLITEKEYKKILSQIYSEYTTQTLNKNKTSYDDITFFFFYHPEFMPKKDIYGFEYHNSNSNNLKDIDTVIKITK
jgi:hypothetical protein